MGGVGGTKLLSTFSLSFSHNAVCDCNGCKSIHSKVKQFVWLKLLLCLWIKLYSMISCAHASGRDLQIAVAVSSAPDICLVIYWIGDIFSFIYIYFHSVYNKQHKMRAGNKEDFLWPCF